MRATNPALKRPAVLQPLSLGIFNYAMEEANQPPAPFDGDIF